jgi:proteasome assembly chaperone 2
MGTNFFKQGMMVEFARNLAHFAVATGMNHVLVLSSLEFMRLQKIDTSRYSNH